MDGFASFNSLIKSNREAVVHHVFLGQFCLDTTLFDLGTKGLEELCLVAVASCRHIVSTIRTLI